MWLVDVGRIVRVLAVTAADAVSLAALDAGAVTYGPVLYRLAGESIVEVRE